MPKRIALYARESVDGCSIADQVVELTKIAESKNGSVVKIYVDQTIFYEKNSDSGIGFRDLCEASRQNAFDLVMVWSTDRIGRSLQEFVSFLQAVQKQNIDLYFHKQELDTTLSSGKALFSVCGIFSEFERAIIAERVSAGHQRALQQGKKLGRPRTSQDIEDQIRLYRDQGMGMRKIAAALKVGVSVVQRVISSDS